RSRPLARDRIASIAAQRLFVELNAFADHLEGLNVLYRDVHNGEQSQIRFSAECVLAVTAGRPTLALDMTCGCGRLFRQQYARRVTALGPLWCYHIRGKMLGACND